MVGFEFASETWYAFFKALEELSVRLCFVQASSMRFLILENLKLVSFSKLSQIEILVMNFVREK